MQEEKQFFSIFSDRNYSFLIIFFIFLVFHIGYSIFKRQKILSFRTNAAAINVIVILKVQNDNVDSWMCAVLEPKHTEAKNRVSSAYVGILP